MTDVMVPSLGESVSEATVSTWFKKVGDTVKQDEMLCELETDKVSVEVPAPVSGVLAKSLPPKAPRSPPARGSASSRKVRSPPPPPRNPRRGPAEGSPGPARPAKDVEDAPAAKKAMAEAGLSPDQVQGTGRDGRIMKEDVAPRRRPRLPGRAPAPVATPAPAPAAVPRGRSAPMTPPARNA